MHTTRHVLSTIALVAAIFIPFASTSGDVVVTNAKVFTGERVIPQATVTFENGLISAINESESDQTISSTTELIDGTGLTLIPGLIDAHTHNFGRSLQHALNFGVTTTVDMFTEPTGLRAMKDEQAQGPVFDRSDIVSAGNLITVSGGHGTQFGLPVPTLDDPSDVKEFVAQRVEEGSDFIKVIYEHGRWMPGGLPTHALDTLPKIVEAAHHFNKLAVFHVGTAQEASEAIQAGADGLAHIFTDTGNPELFAQAETAGIFVVPTLTVIESLAGSSGAESLAADPLISPYIDVEQRQALLRSFGTTNSAGMLDAALKNVAELHGRRVRLLAGTDAGNPGTTWGASMHRELELLVQSGLTPLDALRAATAIPADAFGLDDRGRLEVGLRADAVLVHGDPTKDVSNTKNIHTIFKGGKPYTRITFESEESSTTEEASKWLSNFDDESAGALANKQWVESTDADFGGKSEVALEIVNAGQGRALKISGEIKKGYPYPWAGAMHFLGSHPQDPVDASEFSKISFSAKGEGDDYRVLVFAQSLGYRPSIVAFQAGPEWSRVEIPFSAFRGFKPNGLIAVLFSGPDSVGEFNFQIDEISFDE